MGYEERMLLARLEQKVDLLLEKVAPEVFEEAKPNKKTLAQLKEEAEATDEEEMDDEEEVEEEPKPKPKKKKLFGRR